MTLDEKRDELLAQMVADGLPAGETEDDALWRVNGLTDEELNDIFDPAPMKEMRGFSPNPSRS